MAYWFILVRSYGLIFDVIGVLFDIMAYVMMLWRTFRCYGVLFDVMTYFLMLLRTF